MLTYDIAHGDWSKNEKKKNEKEIKNKKIPGAKTGICGIIAEEIHWHNEKQKKKPYIISISHNTFAHTKA